MSYYKTFSERTALRRLPGEALARAVAREVKAVYFSTANSDSSSFAVLVSGLDEKRFQTSFDLITARHPDLPCRPELRMSVRALVAVALKIVGDNQARLH